MVKSCSDPLGSSAVFRRQPWSCPPLRTAPEWPLCTFLLHLSWQLLLLRFGVLGLPKGPSLVRSLGSDCSFSVSLALHGCPLAASAHSVCLGNCLVGSIFPKVMPESAQGRWGHRPGFWPRVFSELQGCGYPPSCPNSPRVPPGAEGTPTWKLPHGLREAAWLRPSTVPPKLP